MAEVGYRAVFMGHEKEPSLIYEETRLPAVTDGQILAKIRLATVCGSDLHTIKGRRLEATPSVLGHEAVGEVVESRRPGAGLMPGDRFTFSVIESCDQCDNCRHGLPQKCDTVKKVGHLPLHSGSGFTGCYASHIVLGAGVAVFKLEDAVTDRVAAPINCALATVLHATSAMPPHTLQTGKALVQGAGLLGVYSCCVLKELGFHTVYCSDPNRDRLLVTAQFGGSPIYPGVGEGPGDSEVDVVMEVCGDPSVLPEAVRCLRPGGVCLLLGMVHPDSRLPLTGEELIRKCLTLKGIHNYAPCHLRAAVEFVTANHVKYPFDSLLSPNHELKDIVMVMRLAERQMFHRVAIKP